MLTDKPSYWIIRDRKHYRYLDLAQLLAANTKVRRTLVGLIFRLQLNDGLHRTPPFTSWRRKQRDLTRLNGISFPRQQTDDGIQKVPRSSSSKGPPWDRRRSRAVLLS